MKQGYYNYQTQNSISVQMYYKEYIVDEAYLPQRDIPTF